MNTLLLSATMLNSAALVSVMKVVMMILMILGTGVEAAATERGSVKPPHPLSSLTHALAIPEEPSAVNPSKFLKRWLLSTKAAAVDRTTRIADKTTTMTIDGGMKAGRFRTNPETASPDKQAQVLEMISALEELHRTFDSTLNSWITIKPRANNRNSGRKNKVLLPADEGGLKSTIAAPAAVNSTASRVSADVIVPSLTVRNFRKSLLPQAKRTNKRVCFWKYCSQN